jgi:hypothetical protein
MGRDAPWNDMPSRRKRRPIMSKAFVALVGGVGRLGGAHDVTADEFKAWFTIWQRNLSLWEFVLDD